MKQRPVGHRDLDEALRALYQLSAGYVRVAEADDHYLDRPESQAPDPDECSVFGRIADSRQDLERR